MTLLLRRLIAVRGAGPARVTQRSTGGVNYCLGSPRPWPPWGPHNALLVLQVTGDSACDGRREQCIEVGSVRRVLVLCSCSHGGWRTEMVPPPQRWVLESRTLTAALLVHLKHIRLLAVALLCRKTPRNETRFLFCCHCYDHLLRRPEPDLRRAAVVSSIW